MARILILDDEPLISAMLADWLAELQHETVGPAATVEEAIHLVEGGAPDGAILDVSLRGGDSTGCAEALRQRGIPFAFATGHGRGGLPNGFEDALLLTKPFDFDDVRQVLARFLDTARSASQ
jgi:CheY-like chemotaxis protein